MQVWVWELVPEDSNRVDRDWTIRLRLYGLRPERVMGVVVLVNRWMQQQGGSKEVWEKVRWLCVR